MSRNLGQNRRSLRSRAGKGTAVAGLAITAIAIGACAPSLTVATVPWSESQAVISSAIFGKKNLTFDELPSISVENGRIESVTVRPVGQSDRVGGGLCRTVAKSGR